MNDPKVIAAIVGGIFGLIGGLVVAILNHFLPAMGYLIKRKIEKQPQKDAIDMISKTIEMQNSIKSAGLPISLKITEILSDTIGDRMHQYLEFSEIKNAGEIISKASTLFENSDSTKSIDTNWFSEYYSKARKVSDGQVQEMWARILAGEVASPGSFSLKTLNTLSVVDLSTAEIMMRCAGLCINNQHIFLANNNHSFDAYGLPIEALQKLVEHSLLSLTELTLTLRYHNSMRLIVGKSVVIFEAETPNTDPVIQRSAIFRGYAISNSFRELLPLLQATPNMKYIEDIGKFYPGWKIRVENKGAPNRDFAQQNLPAALPAVP